MLNSAVVQGAIVGAAVYYGLEQSKPEALFTAGGQLKDEMKSPLNIALAAAVVVVFFRAYVQGAPLLPSFGSFSAEATTYSPSSNAAAMFASSGQAGVAAADTFYE